MDRHFTIAAAGDMMPYTRIPFGTAETEQLSAFFRDADGAVVNLETNLHNYEEGIWPSNASGGDWVSCPPVLLEDVLNMGFNLISAPNNHSMDFLHQGLLTTAQYLEDSGVTYAGIGKNLYEASRPRYLDTPQGRIALIALNTSFEPGHMAGRQREDMSGRPGINGLRHRDIWPVTEAEFNALKEIGKRFAAAKYKCSDETQDKKRLEVFGQLFEVGEGQPGSFCDAGDLGRITRTIREAGRQADLVLVSCHMHEKLNGDYTEPAEFQRELAHACIAAGADAFLGHGPHVLRGIEIYRDKPICYSLGNFFYQDELFERQPDEFYGFFKDGDKMTSTADGFDYIEEHGGIFGECDPEYYQSVAVKLTFSAGEWKGMEICPLELQMEAPRAEKGIPRPAKGDEAERILKVLSERSAVFGTEMILEDGKGVIRANV